MTTETRPTEQAARPARSEVDLLLCCAASPQDEASVARVNRLIAGGVDWAAFGALVESERVDIAPLVHRSLSAPGVDAPPEVVARLQRRCLGLASYTLHNARELVDVARLLRAQAIEFLPFKGPLLAEYAYGELLLRNSCDLDILVHRSDFDRTRAALESMGYRYADSAVSAAEETYYHNCGFGVRFERPGQPVVVELHWCLVPRLLSVSIDEDGVWQRAREVVFQGERLPTLTPEDLIIYLCIHGSWPGHLWNKLRWICDVAEMTRRSDDFDWGVVMSRARAWRVERIVLFGLCLARRMVATTELPPELAERLDREPQLERLAETIEEWLFCDPAELPGTLRRVELYVKTRERLWDRIRDRVGMLSNDHSLIRVLPLPWSLRFLYLAITPLWNVGRRARYLWRRRTAARAREVR